jgi:hypothetical protein
MAATTTPPPPPSTPPRAPSLPGAPTSRPTAPAGTPRAVAPKIGRVLPKAEPPRMILNAVEGFGKTSFLAHMPAPLIVMARGETGYRTLVNFGRAPSLDAVLVEDWGSLIALLDDLVAQPSLPYQTIGFDAMGGLERLCHEHVCFRDFKNDWGEKGFGAYQKGYDVAVSDWLQFLARLDKLHARGLGVVLLSHCKIRAFKNPLGADFDRYVADVHEKTWAATSKWCDDVLFGTFLSIVDKEKQGKGKGIGGTERVLYTERRDGFDAKNRHGMPEALSMPADHTQGWASLASYFSAPTNPA